MTGIGRRFTRIPWRSELPWPLLLFALFGSFGAAMLGATVGAVIGGVLKLGQPAVMMLTMAGQCVELPALLLIAGVWPPPGRLCGKLGLRPPKWRDFRAALIGLAALLPVSSVAAALWQMLLESLDIDFQEKQDLLVAVADASLPVLVGMGVCVIIVVPVCEEIFFRRLLFGLLRPLGAWAAVAGGAALFSAAHLFLLGAPSLFLMGVAFQLVYLWRRNLAASMLMHAFVNLFAFVGTLLDVHGYLPE